MEILLGNIKIIRRKVTSVESVSSTYPICLVVRWGFAFQNNSKNLELSYETDLDFLIVL